MRIERENRPGFGAFPWLGLHAVSCLHLARQRLIVDSGVDHSAVGVAFKKCERRGFIIGQQCHREVVFSRGLMGENCALKTAPRRSCRGEQAIVVAFDGHPEDGVFCGALPNFRLFAEAQNRIAAVVGAVNKRAAMAEAGLERGVTRREGCRYEPIRIAIAFGGFK